uniref:Signal recognition particle 19 kDa protein n=1 Tax=Gopherus evgoodei TaxID=1825980 RepID=A0A8C4VKG6_9SAUR
MAWAAAASPADKERFICIYPAYLNNKKTIAEGRRIPMDKAIENPTSTEIQDVCAAVGLNVLVEKNKLYPREWNRDVQYRGRVRVQLRLEDGNPCLPQFPTRLLWIPLVLMIQFKTVLPKFHQQALSTLLPEST